MTRDSFDQYDEIPEDMLMYLRYNGKHFNRKLVEYAVSKMTTKDIKKFAKTKHKGLPERLRESLEKE